MFYGMAMALQLWGRCRSGEFPLVALLLRFNPESSIVRHKGFFVNWKCYHKHKGNGA